MPGIEEAPVSAMISTVMVVGVTPMSVAFSVVPEQFDEAEVLPAPAAAEDEDEDDPVTTGLA
jgi:hypothetical protein